MVYLLVFKIGLVSNQVEEDVWVGVLFSLLEPINYIQECIIPRQIVEKTLT